MTLQTGRTLEFLNVSPWLTSPPDVQPALASDRTADVAIVGAGFTGLSTALALKRAGVDVVVLEREFAGFGASGRNAGHLTPTIGKDLPTLLMLFGKRRAAALVRFAEDAVDCVEDTIRERRISCDYVPAGNVMAAVHPKQEARLRKAAAAAAEIGAHVRFLDGGALRARGVPPAFLSGALEERGGTLDPGKYVMGLRRAVLEAGIPLYEGTTVHDIADGPRPRIRAGAGTVTADRVVLATNAYTPALGRLRHTVCPLYVTLFETTPLTNAQLAALGWPGKEGIYTAHESLESYRLTARGTIVGGAKAVRYSYGGALRGGADARTLAIVIGAFRDRFPGLAKVPIAHAWGGWIGVTLHFLPALGTTGAGRNIHYAIGYNGHGVAAASAMGAILADRMLERPNEHATTLARFAPPLPPEPLRWLMVRGIMGVLNRLDARVDRELRRSPSGARQDRDDATARRDDTGGGGADAAAPARAVGRR
jgi:glycine/D-amino acid oxidase-like deaminating enzyme